MLYNRRFTGRHGESHLGTVCSPTIYCRGYDIDNVNITDCVACFVLQELTSQLVMMKVILYYMWRVPSVASMWWSSSIDRGKLYQYVSLTQ